MSDDTAGSHVEPENKTELGAGRRSRKRKPIRPHKWLYWVLYALCLFAYWQLINLGAHYYETNLLEIGPLRFSYGAFWYALVLAHFGFSLKRVHTNEVAGKYFYGFPLFRARAGLNYVPLGVMNLIRYPGDPQEVFLPAKADEVFWGDEEQTLPPGMVRPIWIATRPPTDLERDPLDAQMVVGVVGYAFWRVSDVFTFHARVVSLEEGTSQIRSIWVRVVGEDVVKHTASGAITKQAEINDKLDDNIREHTDDWGVDVESAGITKINVSHTLGIAMRNRAKAPFEAEEAVIKAEAEATARERLGLADGKAARSREAGPLLGRADGLEAIAKVAVSPGGSEALASETLVRTVEKANVVFAGGAEGSLRDLMAGAKAIQTAITPKGGGNDKPAT